MDTGANGTRVNPDIRPSSSIRPTAPPGSSSRAMTTTGDPGSSPSARSSGTDTGRALPDGCPCRRGQDAATSGGGDVRRRGDLPVRALVVLALLQDDEIVIAVHGNDMLVGV